MVPAEEAHFAGNFLPAFTSLSPPQMRDLRTGLNFNGYNMDSIV